MAGRTELASHFSMINRTVDIPIITPIKNPVQNTRRLKGGMSPNEYEELYGNNKINNQPNFSQKRDHY